MDEKKMRTEDVNSMMRHVWIWALLAVVAIFGCNGRDSTLRAEVDIEPPTITQDPLTPEEILKEFENQVNPALKNLDISKPATAGWIPSTDNLAELGKLLDTTFAELENVRCEAMITYAAPVGTMNVQVAVDIKTTEIFNIAFTLPSVPGYLNTAIGDGERRVLLIGDEWEELPAFSATKKPRMDRSDLERFATMFTQDMFALYLEGELVWEPLFSALQSGVGGYEPSVERMKRSRNNKELSYIRVYARTEEDTPTEIEVIINEKWNLPVTVRVVRELEDGSKFKMMWSGAWAFSGGEFAEKNFVIPVPAPKK